MAIEVRKAGLGDVEALMEWRMEVLREVFSLSEETPMGDLAEQNRRYYQKALPAEEHLACFAYDCGEAVGCGGVCFHDEMPSPDNPAGRCAYLMNVYTRPSHRGRGVGRAMVLWLVDEAARRGAGKIYLESSEAGKTLYRNMGFVPLPDMMKLPVGVR